LLHSQKPLAVEMGGVSMKKFAKPAIAAAVVLLVGLLTTASNSAAGAKRAEKQGEKGAAAKTETYAVVRIGDDVQIVKKSDLTNLKKTTAEEDKKAKKDYDEAKKAAKSKEEKANLGKPPVKRKVIVLKSSLKTEDDAKDWLDKNPQGQEGERKTGRKAAAQ
jgi:hypothetical protein